MSAGPAALLLVAARLVPVALLLPARVPLLVRAALAVLLAALLIPVLGDAPLPAGAWALAGLAAKELAVGAVLALLVAAPFAAARAAGAIADAGVGSGDRLADLGLLLAAALLFASDGHLVLVRALAASYQAVPLAAVPPLGGGLAATVIDATAHLILAAVGLAAPVLAALLLADLALALAARAGRGLPLADAAAALRAAAALFALLAALAGVALALRGELGAALARVARPFG